MQDLSVSRKPQSTQDQLFTVTSSLSVAEVATLKSSKNALWLLCHLTKSGAENTVPTLTISQSHGVFTKVSN